MISHSSRYLLSLICLSSLPWTSGQAEILRYTDSKGQEHFVTSAEAVPPQYQDQLRTQKPLPKVTKYDFYGGRTPDSSPISRSGIKIFVTSWCKYCVALERFLEEKRIPFKRYDIEGDERSRTLYESLGVRGVPVTLVGKSVVSGYAPQEIERLYKSERGL